MCCRTNHLHFPTRVWENLYIISPNIITMDETAVLRSMEKTLKEIEIRLSALLALTAASGLSTPDEKAEAKAEIILHRAGLDNAEIAKVLGKNLGAVQKTIQRAKK